MNSKKFRAHSYVICGGAFGDEGKGRIVDMIVHDLSKKFKVIVYRDNGGANAGHTVEFKDGTRVALHQLPSGVFIQGSTVVLGKEMVLHPGDLLEELLHVSQHTTKKTSAKIVIDEMAVLSLDTHRAFENVLKEWQSGSKGSTGRGISPAYADVLLRHPLRMRDIATFNRQKVKEHYALYAAILNGLGKNIAQVSVPTLSGASHTVGTEKEFISRLKKQAAQLSGYVSSVNELLRKAWENQKYAFVFEKAQAVGLDVRWGVYPDVTASDTTPGGIFSATEGIVDPDAIEMRAGVIKATYMSSVGSRVLPTQMEEALAKQIRQDANEYGATTKRPRDIAHLDIPALRFFAKVGRLTHLMLTHMDIVYENNPIKVCTEYKIESKTVDYRPDQEFLNKVKPVYTTLKSWDKTAVATAKKYSELPKEAKQFLTFLEKQIGVPVVLITTGPRREQGIWLNV